jgi:uncharacterized membrane-anchored protein
MLLINIVTIFRLNYYSPLYLRIKTYIIPIASLLCLVASLYCSMLVLQGQIYHLYLVFIGCLVQVKIESVVLYSLIIFLEAYYTVLLHLIDLAKTSYFLSQV